MNTTFTHPMASSSSKDNAYTHKAPLNLGNTTGAGCFFTLALLALAIYIVHFIATHPELIH